ncbi:hypothetical protein pdam_00023646 [Pocillopora damicornis]|uniref:Uncharacterized protein n=1 Tax=Pocillopora damicornis TaxID=46731 RepID=A0A3M6TUX4_POCDA|nr:hypothetical protein pdam_00023646 [Pocillopora damicornis]
MLVQHHEQVGKAFQELQTQKKALAADLEGNKPRNRGTEQQCPGTRQPYNTSPSDDDDDNDNEDEGARKEKKKDKRTYKEGRKKKKLADSNQ